MRVGVERLECCMPSDLCSRRVHVIYAACLERSPQLSPFCKSHVPPIRIMNVQGRGGVPQVRKVSRKVRAKDRPASARHMSVWCRRQSSGVVALRSMRNSRMWRRRTAVRAERRNSGFVRPAARRVGIRGVTEDAVLVAARLRMTRARCRCGRRRTGHVECLLHSEQVL